MQPKKSLGQNFLRDENILAQIIKSANLSTDDLIIEIGPGEGALTQELIKNAGKVMAIEKDDNLALKLEEKYKNNKKIEIIHDDVLEVNLPELIEENSQPLRPCGTPPLSKGEEEIRYKVVANIPYYITSPIIRLFLEAKNQPSEMILMVQKEVAERICAGVGQMSILSVSVQYYAKAEILFFVDRDSFYPIPKVDSAVIRIIPFQNSQPLRPCGTPPLSKGEEEMLLRPCGTPPLSKGEEEMPLRPCGTPPLSKGEEERKKFFRMVKAGFSAKRKTLANNLGASFKMDKKEVEEKLGKSGINPSARAQELSVSDWKRLGEVF